MSLILMFSNDVQPLWASFRLFSANRAKIDFEIAFEQNELRGDRDAETSVDAIRCYESLRCSDFCKLFCSAGRGTVSRSKQVEDWRRRRMGLSGGRPAVRPSLHHARQP